MSDLSQDNASVFRPDKRCGILIVYADKLFDGRHQIRYATERTTANTFVGNLLKPPLNEIGPRRGCRCEVAMKVR
jgi:hypothetical protein